MPFGLCGNAVDAAKFNQLGCGASGGEAGTFYCWKGTFFFALNHFALLQIIDVDFPSENKNQITAQIK